MIRQTAVTLLQLSAWLALLPSLGFSADALELYSTQIKPLFRARCFSCHGALKQEADLRLDSVELMVDAGVITRGDVSGSSIVDRVTATDIDERMPPEHEGEPLTAEQVELLSAWIAAGAPAPPDERPETDPDAHWSFQSVVRPDVPIVKNATWIHNPIDAFIAEAHEQHGLKPQPEASRAVLLRRLYLDLIGLPPTTAEIAAFESDADSLWYAKMVERLLDDPRHGERWARHWMDIWRYSDWWGLGAQLRNSQQHMWHWRDWIIASLNADRGYDEMLRLMLAGDELRPNDPQALAATGYLARNYFLFNRYQWMDETVEHVGKAFLGLTFNCAKCHDHKFDPITQVDYFKLQAFFEPYQVRMDMLPGESDLSKDGVPRAFDADLDAKTYLLIRGEEGHFDKSQVIEPGVPKFLAFEPANPAALNIQTVDLPADAWQPERRAWVMQNYLAAATEKLRRAEAELLALSQTQKQGLAVLALATVPTSSTGASAQTANCASPVLQCDKALSVQVDVQETVEPHSAAATESQLTAELAQLDVDIARAELESLERRYAAIQTQESPASDEASDVSIQDSALRTAAIQAERRLHWLTAQRGLVDVRRRLLTAGDDKRGAIAKEQTQAQQAVDQAQQALVADIKPEDSFTPPIGARWSATRFLATGRDDPDVPFPAHSSGRRSALARWTTDRNNPLTARVAVNHLWTRHLGDPLVGSVFDLGRNGAAPTNAKLLDWLAAELIDSGWSMKHIHRLIVTSAVYRMSSSNAGGESNVALDPDNRLWWRRQPIRLESQIVRDSILSLAGTLDPTMGGPPVPSEKQADSTRRSLYFFHSNNQRDLFLTMFDEALVTDCYRREQSVVPQQALALTNSKLVLTASPQIADRLSLDPQSQRDFIAKSLMTLLSIPADETELAACETALTTWESQPDSSPEQARAQLIWVLLNHNDFVTLR